MLEFIWKLFGIFVFIYVGVANLMLIIIFIIKYLFIYKIPWSIIKRKHGRFFVRLAFISLNGLFGGFLTYSIADTMAKVYHSWVHYVIIIILSFIVYKYRLLPFPFTDYRD